MQPVYRVAQPQRLVRADEEFALILIEGKELVVIGVSLLVAGEILLDVPVDGQTATGDQLVEREWVFRVVDLALEHRIEVLQVDVSVLDERLCGLAHKHDFDAMVQLVQQNVDDLEDEVRLHGHQHLCIEVRLEAVDHLVQQARYLSVEGGSTRLRDHRANEHAVRVLQESVAERHRVAV